MSNILILLICIVIILIFRRLDKSNLKINKVKRFAEKAASELEKMVQNKKQDIHDVTIDLDLLLKRASSMLGELENAPGASRRESADAKRRVVKSSSKLAEMLEENASRGFSNAQIYNSRAKVSELLPVDERKKQPWEYRDLAKEESSEARMAFEKASEHREIAFENKWGARKDSTIAFFQTLGARLSMK